MTAVDRDVLQYKTAGESQTRWPRRSKVTWSWSLLSSQLASGKSLALELGELPIAFHYHSAVQ